MIAVTEEALKALEIAIAKLPISQRADYCFRLVSDDAGDLSLILDPPESDDEIFDVDGTTVLAMPTTLVILCAGQVLDINPEGTFILRDDYGGCVNSN